MNAASVLRWAGLPMALITGLAAACQICVPLPELTLADRLLESKAVVVAREDPERPFQYRAVETLAGTPGEKPIELFLPSQTRRLLAADPSRGMILGQRRKDGQWTALGLLTPEFERVVRGVLGHAGRWQPRQSDDRARLEWFVPLFGHEDQRLHQLAYLEIGRAPYAQIRQLAERIPVETPRAMLDDARYLEWRSLAILLLGESGRSADQARVRDTLNRKARLGSSLNLAAWATALMAVDGAEGIRRLQSLYVTGPARKREELAAVVQALSTHAAADPALRGAVAGVYAAMLDKHPEIAPTLVHDLIAWKRWDFAPGIRQAKARLNGEPLAAYALGLYLRLARVESAAAGPLPGAATEEPANAETAR